MKRDILATIVFLITGALFWIAQTGSFGTPRYSCAEICSNARVLQVVEDSGSAALEGEPEIGQTRDS